MPIEPHSYCSITADAVLILKTSKTTKTGIKLLEIEIKKILI